MAMIMVVDDDLDIRNMLKRDLAKQGHQVVCSDDGNEAWRNIAQRLPDLILTDIAMPGMNGIELCRKLRANPATVATPILFVTVSDDRATQTAAFEAGADDYMIKPFDLTELNLRIHALLRANPGSFSRT